MTSRQEQIEQGLVAMDQYHALVGSPTPDEKAWAEKAVERAVAFHRGRSLGIGINMTAMTIQADELHRLSVNEYVRICDVEPEAFERTELVDGVILTVSPESRLHAQAVRYLNELLGGHYPGRNYPSGSVRFAGSLWNPDLYVLATDSDESAPYPSGTDVELAVEICLSTQHRDLGSKRDVYAQEGVPVYWVVLPESPGRLIVHRRPRNGDYHSIELVDLEHGYRDIDRAMVERYSLP